MKYLKAFNTREKVLLSIILLAVGMAVFFYFDLPKGEEAQFVFEEEVEEGGEDKEVPLPTQENEVTIVLVDVKGAVVAPGVYEVSANGRVKDVIEKAGGFLEEADQAQLNLATKVIDEMMIYVPLKGETTVTAGSVTAESGLVSINTADLIELQELPGIGPAKAEAIIQYREENGPFSASEDLQNISGIGEKTYEKLKDLITVQ
ncbi:helix-hairpin-helix domain-containing protein [Guptibacillus hwajinpoensis]|uniref:helix-hairpin-helix domain-containing protein n=1 Tax=Guptibacillus hwajinpoensis TaxID=208199 RepID=UPI001CD7DF9E|nr:helix-hairpin-helix domain-containing protein [Pseudalkalibacillus hwajinpoensis]MCA0992868.1 helix-hairpin-helix domain-containing protein [Pseudalkalibacillus hwajinpoensis]